jgi:hypothetical protein
MAPQPGYNVISLTTEWPVEPSISSYDVITFIKDYWSSTAARMQRYNHDNGEDRLVPLLDRWYKYFNCNPGTWKIVLSWRTEKTIGTNLQIEFIYKYYNLFQMKLNIHYYREQNLVTIFFQGI